MSLDHLLQERRIQYGDFPDVAQLSTNLLECIISVLDASELDLEPYMWEALRMICSKISRVCNGNPYYIDNWRDIAGYSQLVVNELSRLPESEPLT